MLSSKRDCRVSIAYSASWLRQSPVRRPKPCKLRLASHGVRAENEWPMIQVPYLAADRLDYLTRLGVSGVDLCGNGVVIVPERLYVLRSGQPNQYRDSRPLNNPYRGRSSLVARILLSEPSWPSLSKMLHWINRDGTDLSLAQASKAIPRSKKS